MSKTVLYLLRHGEVENPQKILYGRLPNFGLSKAGREKIQQVAHYFASRKISAIYSSPLKRARETAKILGEKLKLCPHISYSLQEVRLIFEGMPLVEYKKKIQPYLYSPQYISYGQESVEKIEGRMINFLREIAQKHSGKNLLIVSHGDPILIFAAKVQGKVFDWEYKRENYLKPGDWMAFEYYQEKKKEIWKRVFF